MTFVGSSKKQARRCSRAWEVEAARDGRLLGSALADAVRHIEHCEECREQSAYVDGLGTALRTLKTYEVDDVAKRRLRQSVLAQADAELAGRTLPPPRVTRARLAIPSACVVVVAAAALFFMLRSPHRAPQAEALQKTTVETTDEGGAQWSRRSEAEIERVELNEGTLRLKVQKTPGGKRVVVRVPDGEIEDLGTIFHVVVVHGRTQRVGVEEGRVTIRLTNAPPVTISSGQTWERTEEPASVTPSSPALTPSSLPIVGTRPAQRPTSAKPEPSAVHSPSDAAKEDAAYLRALRLARAGREDEAKAAARDYLRAFPDGFRREEMGHLAR